MQGYEALKTIIIIVVYDLNNYTTQMTIISQ
jgi:hypothetical protein